MDSSNIFSAQVLTQNLGQDSVMLLDGSAVYLTVHLANFSKTNTRFQDQVCFLCQLINHEEFKNKNIFLMGDYNSIVTCEEGVLKFYSKDLSTVDNLYPEEHSDKNIQNDLTTSVIENHNVYWRKLEVPTSFKTRIITTQLPKMFDKNQTVIDNVLVFEPKHTGNKQVNLCTEVFSVDEACNPMKLEKSTLTPIRFPSDHYLVRSVYETENGIKKICSWNILGESIQKEVLNIFEFVPLELYSEMSTDEWNTFEENMKAIRNEKMKSMDLSEEDKLKYGSTVKEQMKNKLYSTVLRESSKTPECSFFDIHSMNPEKMDCFNSLNEEVKMKMMDHYSKYQQKLEYFRNESANKKLQRECGEAFIELVNEFYTNPKTKSFFEKLFVLALTSKKYSAIELVKKCCELDFFDVMGLQEVPKTGFCEELEKELPNGYRIIKNSVENNGKTIGILIVKE